MARVSAERSGRALVVDTNVALDLLLFDDPATQGLRAALAAAELDWIGTTAMDAEFARVLHYPAIARQCRARGRDPAALQAAWRAAVRIVEAPAAAAPRCDDPDDQGFIDLAVAHRALLLSRDRAVLQLAGRLAALGVAARPSLQPPAPAARPARDTASAPVGGA